ncbi:hypothetical protein SDC9_166788 [bioreactor metagenome]|uniref:Uncharacterized protein n=1 Tax=bioreactor metagenome TaxID=1076179 RepID=A0A645G0M4_9ZZZZ
MQPFEGLRPVLPAEGKGLKVNRQQPFRAGRLRHPNRFFRRAVRAGPRVISTVRHDGEFKRPLAAQFTKTIGIGCVSAEDDAFALALQDVAVVTAVPVIAPAGTPMADLKGLHTDSFASNLDLCPVTPSQ